MIKDQKIYVLSFLILFQFDWMDDVIILKKSQILSLVKSNALSLLWYEAIIKANQFQYSLHPYRPTISFTIEIQTF